MISRERMLSAFNHPDPDRVPLFAPDAMNTREPYDDRVRRFLDDFAFDRSACLGGLTHPPNEHRELKKDIFLYGYAPDGGYWFKAQAISPVIPPQNVIAAYETALEYGQYRRR